MTQDCKNTLRLIEWTDLEYKSPKMVMIDPLSLGQCPAAVSGSADWQPNDVNMYAYLYIVGEYWLTLIFQLW